MKCPYCGYEDEGLGTTCDNCWREIRQPPGTSKTCRSCGNSIPAKARFCPDCGAESGSHAASGDEVLAQEDFGPLWTGGPSDISYKYYDDRVVVEQDYYLTGAKRVTTVRRGVFRASSLVGSLIFLTLGVIIMALGAIGGIGLIVLLGLAFAGLSIYSLSVFMRMEAKAAQRREEDRG